MPTTAHLRDLTRVAVAVLLGLYALRLRPMNGRRAPIVVMIALTLSVAVTIMCGGTFSDSPVP